MMKTGDVLICKRNSFLSKMIQLVTKSNWSHTAIIVEFFGQIYVADMQKKGIELNPIDEWKLKWNYEFICFRNVDVERFNENEIGEKIVSVVGSKTKYDFFTFIFRIPYKLITKKYKFKGDEIETKRMICSQFTGWIHNMNEWWKMTPISQLEYLEKSNKYIKIF